MSLIKSRKMTASLNVKIVLNLMINILKRRSIPRKLYLRLEGQGELKTLQPRLRSLRSAQLSRVRLPAAGSGPAGGAVPSRRRQRQRQLRQLRRPLPAGGKAGAGGRADGLRFWGPLGALCSRNIYLAGMSTRMDLLL